MKGLVEIGGTGGELDVRKDVKILAARRQRPMRSLDVCGALPRGRKNNILLWIPMASTCWCRTILPPGSATWRTTRNSRISLSPSVSSRFSCLSSKTIGIIFITVDADSQKRRTIKLHAAPLLGARSRFTVGHIVLWLTCTEDAWGTCNA